MGRQLDRPRLARRAAPRGQLIFPMPYRIGKTFEFESGHMLSKHSGKCRFPHGHSRRVEIVLAADALDANDMVCDFQAIKQIIKAFIDHWDHALCLNTADPHCGFYRAAYGDRIIPFAEADPTSEVMVKAIFDEVKRKLAEAPGEMSGLARPISPAVRLERVRLTETSSSWAEYEERASQA
jgi:6-pyruvoyltetrahydropterin/6-carboxytetrahydropterin synthase